MYEKRTSFTFYTDWSFTKTHFDHCFLFYQPETMAGSGSFASLGANVGVFSVNFATLALTFVIFHLNTQLQNIL